MFLLTNNMNFPVSSANRWIGLRTSKEDLTMIFGPWDTSGTLGLFRLHQETSVSQSQISPVRQQVKERLCSIVQSVKARL